MKKSDAVVKCLLGRNFKEISSKSRKYRTFESPSGKLYFVGRSGALRTGKSSSDSISITSSINRILEREDMRDGNY